VRRPCSAARRIDLSADRLITIVTEIRDQQKQQIANYERAMHVHDEALALQRRSRGLFIFLVFMPWALVALLLALLVFRPLFA